MSERTRLDEIVDEEICLVDTGGSMTSVAAKVLHEAYRRVIKRIAERAFRNGVEQHNCVIRGDLATELSTHCQPAPADDGIKRCVHGQAIHCDKGCYKDRRKGPKERREQPTWKRCACACYRNGGAAPRNHTNQRTGPRDRRKS